MNYIEQLCVVLINMNNLCLATIAFDANPFTCFRLSHHDHEHDVSNTSHKTPATNNSSFWKRLLKSSHRKARSKNATQFKFYRI